MSKSLVIVESPAKARTINKYLGNSYNVMSSVGHVRDLPKHGQGRLAPKSDSRNLTPAKKAEAREKRASEALVRRMGIDPDNGWEARYEILPDKVKVIKELREAAEKAETIFLATDMDREGEAIAWHLQEVIGGGRDRYRRVIFSEITQNAIKEAFNNPGDLNMDRVRAQQARRFLDRVVGFMLSPLLWKKIARGLSAGRVQSIAVRLITEREKEIHSFIPEEYWEAMADLKGVGEFQAGVWRYRGKPFKPTSREEAERAKSELEKEEYRVIKREDKPTKKRPNAPLITSTLQQAASLRLGFSVKKTMTLAQRLYEAGYITYMRTDSTNLSSDALSVCRSYIHGNYGERYLPEQPNFYKSKSTAQEAHEAIRPSDVNVNPASLTALESDQMRLYDLIWRRFVACQMTAAEFDSTTVIVQAGDYELKANGRIMRFDGWMKVLSLVKKKGEEDVVLPNIKVGDLLAMLKLTLTQHFTKPPPRYNEASLVKELEKRGIGRPSTYASIISTIQARGYVRLENKRFHAEKMGDIVTERLVENFGDILNYGFTADLEEELDAVARADLDWKKLLDSFYAKFKKDLDAAEVTMRKNNPTLTEISCLKCGRPMGVRTARTGVFLSCSGYDLPEKEKCKSTISLVRGEEVEHVEDADGDAREILSKHRCPKCGTAMDDYLIDENRKLHICGNNPDCDGFELEEGKFRIKGYDGPIITCDRCGADMELKTGRFGKFFGCTNYPECTNTRKLMRNGEPAPPKMTPIPMPELECDKSDGHFVLREGTSGLFLASNLFPKSRETRSPLVSELAGHREELDPKYHYLADAPCSDPDGNPAIVRFNRKERFHYLISEKNGKASSWTARYEDGQWAEKTAKERKNSQ
jgi:DNA topoisomerase-1